MDFANKVANALRDDVDPDGTLTELQRLIQCYQIADDHDKDIVWAALNKYAPYIDDIR